MTHKAEADFDAVVIGAGFGGIYALHKLRNELGLTVRAFEKGGGVGGTWYWNRYPGAMSDVDGHVYKYSFDKELLQEWDWHTRYTPQAETLAYLETVVERHDLARDIQFDTAVESAAYDEFHDVWTLTTDTGETVTARYVVSALGPLSSRNFPDIKGLDRFEGTLVHTSAWPEDLSIDGKRVGVIGTGSTGTQFVCAASQTAAHLTVFQRTAQYVVPSGNGPVDEAEKAAIRADYDRIWEQVRTSRVGCGFEESDVPAMSVSEEERRRVFQEAWDLGNGFRFMFGSFGDIAVDPDANEAAAEFIRSKIREIVKDPETARKLTPSDLYAKRPICNQGYYEAYNRDNVSLVSLRETPIVEATAKGVVTEDGVEHELDVLVFATGFDAVDGSYKQMDIRGRGGETIREHWEDGASSYLGVSVAGFPNLFMVLGPNSAFSNLPPGIETQVEWIAELVKAVEDGGLASIEATREAEDAWSVTCQETADYTLFPKVESWIFGANIPGKKRTTMFYFAGLGSFRDKLREVTAAGYEGYVLRSAAAPTGELPTAA
ncbi:flavin-containing monooxygenase [Streptomyces montanus]|uniref:flavin-containing monooxygenase n=1 Tax=Streptomyces montanus TaxID=2580423 RepID=UPI001BB23CD6|nr:NAD(P)/FAD-dependent oxidoreductase [Streptomyces montanus]